MNQLIIENTTENQLLKDNIEALQKENTEILAQIEIMVKALERRKAKYEANAVEIHNLNKILEGDLT